MTKARLTVDQRVELVSRYLHGATVPELAMMFDRTEQAIVRNLTTIYKTRVCGRRIAREGCVLPGVVEWLEANCLTASWLATQMGVTKQMVGYYMSGKNKLLRKRMAQICNITGLTEAQARGL